ncbi:MAG: alpha/beta hydrolase [Clostridia bacterium]|nr:alpha/beta hydrolase [Clostridia bacterium]
MDKLYLRGMAGQYWYNATEMLAYALLYRRTPEGLIYEKKVKYGEDKLQYINFYSPKVRTKEKMPLLIYIHGGGFVSGVTEMRNTYISNWAKKGFLTASISYTYAPQKVFPAQFKEIFSAIDFILDKADEYNFDPEKIILAGESAGGYFISYVASCLSDKSRLDKLGIDFKHKDTFKIKALISHCGCYDFKNMVDKNKPQAKFPDIKMMSKSFFGKDLDMLRKLLSSPDGNICSPQITKDFPPIFVIWCNKDLLRYEAFDLEKKLKENSVEYTLYKCGGLNSFHAWSIVTLFKQGKACFDEAYKFAMKQITKS